MCNREEIRSIVSDIVGQHESKEIEFHKLIMANHELLTDKLEQTLVAVRDSVPGSFSSVFVEQNKRMKALEERLAPVAASFQKADSTAKTIIFVSKLAAAFSAIIVLYNLIKSGVIK